MTAHMDHFERLQFALISMPSVSFCVQGVICCECREYCTLRERFLSSFLFCRRAPGCGSLGVVAPKSSTLGFTGTAGIPPGGIASVFRARSQHAGERQLYHQPESHFHGSIARSLLALFFRAYVSLLTSEERWMYSGIARFFFLWAKYC